MVLNTINPYGISLITSYLSASATGAQAGTGVTPASGGCAALDIGCYLKQALAGAAWALALIAVGIVAAMYYTRKR